MTKVRFDNAQLPIAPDFSHEISLWSGGLRYVAGIDEAGRGALAGPVTAAALLFPPDPDLPASLQGVRDSKQMTPVERAFWAGRLRILAMSWGIGFASHQEIDALGIVPATRLAAQRALAHLKIPPQHLLVDFLDLPECAVPYTPLVNGDARCLSIAAASILAKTARDAFLCQLDAEHPGYGFASHKGYGTAAHREAILRLGPCPIHRLSFKPLARDQESGIRLERSKFLLPDP